MKTKLAVVLAALALVLSACGSSVEPEPGEQPAQEQPAAENGGDQGGNVEDGQGGDGGGEVDPENQPPEEVVPTTPPEGGTLTLSPKVEARGADPDQGFSRPTLLLVRNESAEGKAASRSPSPRAADEIRKWSAYAQRAIIAVFGGAQPDAGHSIRVDGAQVTKKGRNLTVFVAIEAGDASSAQVVSVPWAVVSVPAGEVANVRNCFVALNQQSIPAQC